MFAKSEPVRMYLYGLLAPLLAVLVFYGVVESSAVALFFALGAAVLGVPAVEVARSKVTPVDYDAKHDAE